MSTVNNASKEDSIRPFVKEVTDPAQILNWIIRAGGDCATVNYKFGVDWRCMDCPLIIHTGLDCGKWDILKLAKKINLENNIKLI